MSELPHHPAKLPFYIVLAGALVIAEIVYVRSDRWLMAALGVVALVNVGFALRAIDQGRNPWWTQAPIDRLHARRRSR